MEISDPILIGLLINPVAGMGGRVGLKGTDGMCEEALRRGAEPGASRRALSALRQIGDVPLKVLTCSGDMGEKTLLESGISSFQVVYKYEGMSTAKDTTEACREFLRRGVSLILFCGGDGTARDVFSVVEDRVPILGIPAGVKMYSAVFAINPTCCAEIIRNLDRATLRESEVVDVDENAYRDGALSTKVYGYARMPSLPMRVQMGKQEYAAPDEQGAKEDIALFITEIMKDDVLYILGAGTTTAEIVHRLGIPKTLLGVDVVMNGRLIAQDADERTLISLLEQTEKAKIVVSPIGAQGFVLGRGTQSISPEVVRMAGVANVIVVATPHKLAETRTLYLDTGEVTLDRMFGDSILVISGYRMGQRRKLLHPELPDKGSQKD
jgi:predicted polyphosphate/ATP-dependent NAD kinase